MQKKKIILLAGPTASGKSKLAIKIAQHIKGEIVNADSMQIYKEISILNSKPNIKDMKIIRHHLYGFNSARNFFSTGNWLEMSLIKIKEIWDNKKTPIIVGGTGLYFKTLTEGLVKIPEIPNNIRNEIRRLNLKIGQKKFFDILIKLDPLAKRFILSTDKQRSVRAYEVKKYTGRSLFDFMKETKSNFKRNIFIKLFVNTPKEILNGKIEKRVEKMFKEGALEEVKRFMKIKIRKEMSSNKIIGISEIKDYLNGEMTLERTKELINQKTRQYAKRQLTWSRGHMKSWEKIYSSDFKDLFKKAINKIS
tara:strand:+ start:620 stop:1540 length:921 start_codon:yes stop_codon:yes gene_type:complete